MDTLVRLVRPVVTLSFTACLIYLSLVGKCSADFINGVCVTAITWWFAERARNPVPERLPLAGEEKKPLTEGVPLEMERSDTPSGV